MDNEKKSNGALIGLIVIVIILVIGGIYIWHSGYKDIMTKIKSQKPASVENSIQQ